MFINEIIIAHDTAQLERLRQLRECALETLDQSALVKLVRECAVETGFHIGAFVVPSHASLLAQPIFLDYLIIQSVLDELEGQIGHLERSIHFSRRTLSVTPRA